MSYKELRQKYPEFVYEKFDYEVKDQDLVVNFLFRIGSDLEFNPSVKFLNIPKDNFTKIDKLVIDNFVFHLGLCEMLSYWKLACSPKIIVNAGYLDENQISWWTDLLYKGMGQYFFENEINFTQDNFISMVSTSDKKYQKGLTDSTQGLLIPVGGGKDSAVTLELLKGGQNVSAFVVNPTPAAKDLIQISGIKRVISVERTLDPKLTELNSKGFLNGHTPFSSVIAFLSVTAAYLYGYNEVALSNEQSSNEENTQYLGQKINHQYSKTIDFENKFRNYLNMYLTDVNYFSFLRPLYELQIAKVFSTMPKYFGAFRSCNIGQKTNSWCNNCSKCLSTYILLKPFLTTGELNSIFGEDLLNKESLKPILSTLLDNDKVKPFECVGTRAELRAAIDGDLSLLTGWNENNNLPVYYERLLRNQVQK